MTPTLKKRIFTLFLMMSLSLSVSFASPLSIRGVVYDVGLMFGGTSLSLEKFDTAQVAYDMSVISHVMCCNAIRIEGDDIGRLKKATELAHAEGLKVYFNPWKHEANEEETNSYLQEASIVAEELRLKGVDITFVTNIGLLEQAKADGIFVYVFRYPIYPYRSTGLDMDKVSYSLVKSFPKEDARYNAVPSWEPKEAFFRLGQTYSKLGADYDEQ